MNRIIVFAVSITAIIVSSYFLFKVPTPEPLSVTAEPKISKKIPGVSPQPTQNPSQNTGVKQTYSIVYSNSGYSPKTLTIKVGETVVFTNDSSNTVWTASDTHPFHTNYSGTSLQQHCPDATHTVFDQCDESRPGESWSFTFDKTGTWKYHNHLNAPDIGTIIVR